MIETIKKHITEKNDLKLAEEIIKKFEKETVKSRLNFKLNEIEISNFGILEDFNFKFDKDIVFFEGNRNSGKSWAMESWLYLLTGKSRTTTKAIGDYGDKITGELKFNNNLLIEYKRGKTASVKLKKDGLLLSSNIRDLNEIIGGHIGVNPELLENSVYYSPRFSLQFSRKMPYEIEEFLIKVFRLDIWLELEKYAKELRKQEKSKLDEIIGVIGYINDIDYTPEELNKNIKDIEKKLTDIDKQINNITMPDITQMNKEFNLIRQQLNRKKEIKETIAEYQQKEKILKEKKQEFEKLKKESEKLNQEVQDVENLKQNIDTLELQLNDIKAKGIRLKEQIEEKKEMTNNSKCPVLNIDCDELIKYNSQIEKQIVDLTTEKNKLADEYKKINDKITGLKNKLDDLISKQYELNEMVKNVGSFSLLITEIESELKQVNIEKLKKELEKFPKTLESDLEKLNSEIQNVNNIIKDNQEEKDNLFDDKTELLSDLKDYKEKLENFNKMEQFIKEKNKLEKRQKSFNNIIAKFGKKEIPKLESKNLLNRLNKNINLVLEKISNEYLSIKIDENFEMSIKRKDKEKLLSPQTVSLGEEHLINLSFIAGIGLFLFKNKLPYFFVDDVAAFQTDKTAKEIINGLIELQKSGNIERLYLCSNRLKDLRINQMAEQILEFNDGKYKVKETK